MLALDLFCGGGGAALGLIAAGFDVVGIDIERKHHKVYPGRFIQGDATTPPVDIMAFDFVWASPPCQAFSVGAIMKGTAHLHYNLIPAVRTAIAKHLWTCIENVPGAPIRPDFVLTGPIVGLPKIVRQRHFETSFDAPLLMPSPVQRAPILDCMTITKRLCASNHYYRRKAAGLPGRVPVAEAREAMGITTRMTADQVGEAVPPAYAEFIARQAIEAGCGRVN